MRNIRPPDYLSRSKNRGLGLPGFIAAVALIVAATEIALNIWLIC